MWWLGGLITPKSEERTKGVYDYLPFASWSDQSVRSMTLSFAAYCTKSSAAVGAGG